MARTGYHIHQNCNFENKRNSHISDIKTFICKGFYEAFIYQRNTSFSLEPRNFLTIFKIFRRDVSLKKKGYFIFLPNSKRSDFFVIYVIIGSR